MDRKVILTNGFIKKTQKTPAGEIEKAKNIAAIICGEWRWWMAKTFDDFLQEQLQNPEFREEYEALQPERAIIQAIIDARQQSGLTQKELSERTGIAQGDISKMERGKTNPSLRTLQRLAAGMGMIVKLEFLPKPGCPMNG